MLDIERIVSIVIIYGPGKNAHRFCRGRVVVVAITSGTSDAVKMDQRELDSRLKALQKAVNEKEPVSNVVAILETLKKEVMPTEELLRVSL